MILQALQDAAEGDDGAIAFLQEPALGKPRPLAHAWLDLWLSASSVETDPGALDRIGAKLRNPAQWGTMAAIVRHAFRASTTPARSDGRPLPGSTMRVAANRAERYRSVR